MGHVLVLNASYEPLNITSWRRATVMLLKGKAEGLEHDPSLCLRPGLQRPSSCGCPFGPYPSPAATCSIAMGTAVSTAAASASGSPLIT
jgi:hypothetical protein